MRDPPPPLSHRAGGGEEERDASRGDFQVDITVFSVVYATSILWYRASLSKIRKSSLHVYFIAKVRPGEGRLTFVPAETCRRDRPSGKLLPRATHEGSIFTFSRISRSCVDETRAPPFSFLFVSRGENDFVARGRYHLRGVYRRYVERVDVPFRTLTGPFPAALSLYP